MRFYSPKKKPIKLDEWHGSYCILPRRIGNHIYCFHWVMRRGKYHEGGMDQFDYPYWEWEYGL